MAAPPFSRTSVHAPAPPLDASPTSAAPLTAFCIEVALRPERRDVVADRVLAQARELGLELPDGLRSRRGWSLRVRGGEVVARRLAENLLVDPVMNTLRLLSPAQDPREAGSVRLEVVRLPGVMDPSAQSVVRAASRLGLHVQDVRSCQVFLAQAGTDGKLL